MKEVRRFMSVVHRVPSKPRVVFHVCKRMSATKTIIPIVSITSLVSIVSLVSLSMFRRYHIQECLSLKDQHVKDKERIQILEEEIIRLNREMRICGITVPVCPLITSSSPPLSSSLSPPLSPLLSPLLSLSPPPPLSSLPPKITGGK